MEEALHKLEGGLHKKRSIKKYDKVMVKIGRLREKYSRASKQYTISVEKDDTTGNATKITWQRQVVGRAMRTGMNRYYGTPIPC